MKRRHFLYLSTGVAAAAAVPVSLHLQKRQRPLTYSKHRRAFDGAGGVYEIQTTNHRIDRVTSAGTGPRALADGQLLDPVAFASIGDEHWVVESGGRVRAFSSAGAPILELPANRLLGPRDIAVTDDAVLVADVLQREVVIFDRRGRELASLGEPAVRLWGPRSVTIAADGLLHVADVGRGEIVVIDGDREVDAYGGDTLVAPRCARATDDGRVVVVDAVAGGLYYFDRGRLQTRAELPDARWAELDPSGGLHVALA